MECEDIKNIDMGIQPYECFGDVFPVWIHQKIPDKFEPLKKFIQWSK